MSSCLVNSLTPKHGEGKCAIVTGASSGIGQAIVSRLLAGGWRVIGVSRSRPAAESPHFQFMQLDLSNFDQLRDALTTISAVDAIVHAAGFLRTAPLGSLKTEDAQAMWSIHVEAAAIMVNSLVNRVADGGRIVLVGSRTSNGAAGRSQYAATKAALLGMARSWAAELLERRIAVNVVAPGATETPMLLDPKRGSTPPRRSPMGRFLHPDEVAGTVEFLLGPDAGLITGQQIVMCGGSSL